MRDNICAICMMYVMWDVGMLRTECLNILIRYNKNQRNKTNKQIVTLKFFIFIIPRCLDQ